jgi:AcrR family transcriptional regulator
MTSTGIRRAASARRRSPEAMTAARWRAASSSAPRSRSKDRRPTSLTADFAGKEELLEELLAEWIAQAGEQLASHEAGSNLAQEPALRARVSVYWHTYRAHLPEIRALGQAAQVSPAFARRLSQIRHAELQTMRGHLERLRADGFGLPGDPAVLASAFNALLEGFCAIWIAGGGEPIGRSLSDDEAIDTLTGLLAHGLLGSG